MIVRSIHTLIVCAVVLLTLNVKQTASTTTLLSSSRNPLSIVHGAHTALSHTDMTTDLSTLVDKYMKAPNSSDQERTASLLHTSRDSLHHSEYHHNSNDGRVLDGEVVGEAGEHGDLDSGIDHTTDHNNGRVGMEHDRVGSGRKLLSLSTAASFSSLSSRVGIRMKEDGATGDATAKKAETEETPVGMCEVCVYVVENKQQAQPFLCRGLKDSNYQSLVSIVYGLLAGISFNPCCCAPLSSFVLYRLSSSSSSRSSYSLSVTSH